MLGDRDPFVHGANQIFYLVKTDAIANVHEKSGVVSSRIVSTVKLSRI